MGKPTRKPKPQRASVVTPVEKLGRRDTIGHYNAVLIEEIKSGVKQVIEGVDTSIDGLRTELGDFRKEANGRFAILEAAVTQHSKDIKEIKSEMHEMEGRLSTKIDRIGTRVDDHEDRITAIETAQH